jgi:hypothetical protein
MPKPPVEGDGEGAARFYTIVSKLNLESGKQDAVVKWGTGVRGLTYDWGGLRGRSNALGWSLVAAHADWWYC